MEFRTTLKAGAKALGGDSEAAQLLGISLRTFQYWKHGEIVPKKRVQQFYSWLLDKEISRRLREKPEVIESEPEPPEEPKEVELDNDLVFG
ncbi:MAG TPA: hypothetical protein VK673_21905 [Chthoniobacterales bacterium]|nr:hypothetical protein [Chthoniobacterales bacterium]